MAIKETVMFKERAHIEHTAFISEINIFYWFLPEMCTVFNLEANWFQLYKGAHEVTDIIK